MGVALAAIAYLLIRPATADMAAHAFRAWLFDTEGMTVWNAQWYGGHHVLGYSMLFAPLAAWPGPAWVGALARRRRDRGVRAARPRGRAVAGAAAAATWLFGAGVLSNVVIGRMPFTLGIALAVTAWLCAERSRAGRWRGARGGARARSACSRARSRARSCCSPRPRGRRTGRRELGRAAALALPVAIGGGAMALLFPEGGDDRFVATAFWPMLAVSVAGAALLAPGRRALRAGALLYVVVLVGAVRRSRRRSGRTRCGCRVLLGPALLLLAPRARAPRARARGRASSRSSTCSGCRPCARSAEAHDDPSTEASFYAEARAFLASAVRPGERVEVAFTHNHWEAAHLATPCRSRAAGSASSTRRPTRSSTTDGRSRRGATSRWLRETAVRWVALPDAPLDYSAEAEARAARARDAVPAARARVGPAGGSGRCATPTARVRRRARAAADPAGFEVESRRADRGAPALHALLARRRRLRDARARRLDARRRRCAAAACGCTRGFAAARRPDCATAASRRGSGNPPGSAGHRGLTSADARSAPDPPPTGWIDLLRQIVLFCGAYWLYRLVRGLVDGRAAEAFDNARAIIDVERALGLFVEPSVHAWASGARSWLIDSASWMYVNSHFAITTRHARLDLPAPQRALLLRAQHVHGRHGHRAGRLRAVPDGAAALHARVGLQRLGRRVHGREGRLRLRRRCCSTRSPPCRRCTWRSR